jgi:Anti-sigma-28 factor, FlgM
MAMEKINGSPLMRPGVLDRFQVGKKDKDDKAKSGGVNTSNVPDHVPADKAEISDTAHQLMDLRAAVDVGRAALESVADVREDKVAEAKKRVEQGYYNSQVVQDELAETLSKVLGNMDEI